MIVKLFLTIGFSLSQYRKITEITTAENVRFENPEAANFDNG